MNMATKIYQFMQEGESVRYVLIQENLSVMPKISILDSKKVRHLPLMVSSDNVLDPSV